MEKKVRNLRQDVIDFFNKYHRAPSSKREKPLYQIMWKCIKSGDEEIIALVEKYKDNTKKYVRQRQAEGCKKARPAAVKTRQKGWPERISRIRKQFEETGSWPKPRTTDYNWAKNKRTKSEEIMKLWEDMHKTGEKKEIRKPVEKTPAGIEAKKVSELTMGEVSELLKLIGDKTVGELVKPAEEPIKGLNKADLHEVCKKYPNLSEKAIRIAMNPTDDMQVVVTNPEWENSLVLINWIAEDLAGHVCGEEIMNNETVIREIALRTMDHPKKNSDRRDKIAAALWKGIEIRKGFYENQANVKDLLDYAKI